jgi:hypothetical protein
VVVYIGQLFFLITELAHFFGLLFPQRTSYVFILTKNGLGYILGDFFTNSSGHPGRHVGFLHRVARWFVFKSKIAIWVNFGGP